MIFDAFLFLINSGGWALKPIFEKISVDRIGFLYFTFLRYVICGLISLPFLIYCYKNKGCPKYYKEDIGFFVNDMLKWSLCISIIAISAVMANYYLLEKYGPAMVIPITEALLIIFNTIFSVIILKETINFEMILGIFLILIGIILIYKNNIIK